MRIIVAQGQTLETIAEQYLGDSTQADMLASVNNLEYPFIVNNPAFNKFIYATGTITVTLTQSSPLTIPIGTQFQTQAGYANEVRTFQTTQQATLTTQGQSVSIPIQCTVPGHFGNVLPNTITVSPNISGISVTNPSATSGGKILRVLVPGDSITIPDTSTQPNNTSRLSLSEYDDMGGTDLYRTPQGGFVFTTDDLLSISGPAVIAQDIGAVIVTPLGSIPDAPAFGTIIPSSLGAGGDYAMERLAVAAQGAAQADSRVQSAGAVSITPNGTWVEVGLSVTLNSGQSVQVQVTATGGGQ